MVRCAMWHGGVSGGTPLCSIMWQVRTLIYSLKDISLPARHVFLIWHGNQMYGRLHLELLSVNGSKVRTPIRIS